MSLAILSPESCKRLEITERDFPRLPELALRTLSVLRDPKVTNSDFEALLREDKEFGLCDRVIKIANSPCFRMASESRTVAEAVCRLGRRRVYQIIMTTVIGRVFDCGTPLMDELWNHAIATGIAARAIASQQVAPCIDDAFTAGLLHDVGKWVVHKKYPELYIKLDHDNRRLCVLEPELLPHLSHTSVGERLVSKWGLPKPIVESVRDHHTVETDIPTELSDPILPCIVSLASVIANNLRITSPVCSWQSLFSLRCSEVLRFSLEQLQSITDHVRYIFETADELF